MYLALEEVEGGEEEADEAGREEELVAEHPLRRHCRQREFFIDNLLVRIHFIIVMIRWTGLAPWEFEFRRGTGRRTPASPSLPGHLAHKKQPRPGYLAHKKQPRPGYLAHKKQPPPRTLQ